METDELGSLVLVEVTVHGIAHVGLEFAPVVGLGKDRRSQRLRGIPPSGDSSTMKMTSSMKEAPAILTEDLIQAIDFNKTATKPPL